MNDIAVPFDQVLLQDAAAWALRINARWRQSRENILEAGQLIIDAKAALAHGDFEDMVQSKLMFHPSTARRLIAIAQDPRIRAHVHELPVSWSTMYELTKLTDEQFLYGIEHKIIRPEMERSEVELIRPTPHRAPSSDGGVEKHGDHGQTRSESPGALDRIAEVATGPSEATPMPSGGLAIAHPRAEPSDSLDFFPTPPWATRALIEHVFAHLGRDKQCKFQIVWEPACGKGHMAEPLKEYFRDVLASDIAAYGYEHQHEKWEQIDFLNHNDLGRQVCDWIITNPPFNDSTDFVLKALKRAGTGVAMFVRLAWLESVGRYEKIFRDHPPTQLAIFTERVPLHKGRWEDEGTTMTAYIWLVWIKGAEARAPFWIPPGCRESLTRADDVKRFGKSVVEGEAA